MVKHSEHKLIDI